MFERREKIELKNEEKMAFGTSDIRAFASGMLNAICKVYLAFFPQKPSTSGIANAQCCKFFYNLATVPF